MSVELQPSASYGLTLRLELSTRPGTLGRVTTAIGEAGGDIDAIDIVRTGGGVIVRDITVACRDEAHGESIARDLERIEGVRVLHVTDRTFLVHLGGKIDVVGRVPVKTRDDLSMVYTPGVARVCLAIRDDPAKQWTLTVKRHTIAVVTDGSPVFGGINLEDIASPRCFEIEDRLRRTLSIPVMHDDQHGTAIVVLAALKNAARVVGRELADLRVVVAGAGAAGVACPKILLEAGIGDIAVADSKGILHRGREDLTDVKRWLVEHTNRTGFAGTMLSALEGADVYLGV